MQQTSASSTTVWVADIPAYGTPPHQQYGFYVSSCMINTLDDESPRVWSTLAIAGPAVTRRVLCAERHVPSSYRYDPDPSTSVIEEDFDTVQTYVMLEDESALTNLSPWLLRLELHRNIMVDKQLQNTEVAFRIAEEYGESLNCMFSDDNAEKRIIRVSYAVSWTGLLAYSA